MRLDDTRDPSHVRMGMNRRQFSIGLAVFGLPGCGVSVSGDAGVPTSEVLPSDLRPAHDSGYDAWVAGFRNRAESLGFTKELTNFFIPRN